MSRVFNGTSDRIDLANEANFDRERTDPQSAAMWVVISALPPGGGIDQAVFVGKDGAGGTTGWQFYVGSDGIITVEYDGTTEFFVVGSQSTVPVASWHHIGFSYDGTGGSGVVMYLDGSVFPSTVGSDTLTSQSILNDLPVQLGAVAGTVTPERFLTGNLSGFGIWNVELSAPDFATLATGADPLTVVNENLIAALPLCGLLSPEPDVKNGNNGTLFGTTGANGPSFFQGCPVDHGSAVEWLIKA